MKKTTMIQDTDLSPRVKNTLINFGKILTVDDLMKADEKRLLALRGIGTKSLEEIREFLSQISVK